MLRGEQPILLRRDKAAALKRALKSAVKKRAGDPAATLSPAAAKIFEALRAERGRLAREQSVPPYVIFHDSTLIAMATTHPRTMRELAGIPGMGEKKLERYGATFLAALNDAG